MKQLLPISLLGLVLIASGYLTVADFEDSLHYTRNGKATWYAKENGGFELLTQIPMDSLSCTNCHPATKADGTPIDPATYEPDCFDCHNAQAGFSNVESSVCLGCHGRQAAEINLSQHPTLGSMYTDVHRDAGLGCVDCHTDKEMHGDDVEYNSMFEEGATETRCESCHSYENGKMAQNVSHDIHIENVDCASCHAKTVTTCYNCHFETELAIDKKRFYGPPPMGGFVLLVNDERKGKVATASFQSLTYGDTTFYAVGPFGPHTITAEARGCLDCHTNDNIQEYDETGGMDVVRWDDAQKRLVPGSGVIPAPPDWSTAWRLDFVRFLGDASDAIDSPVDPSKWEFMKDQADLTQMLYVSPLTEEQMAALSADVTSVESESEIPSRVELYQNYPNPFNPATSIGFYLPEAASVRLVLYDVTGRTVKTILEEAVRPAGGYGVILNAEELPSGTYVYRLEGDGILESKVLTLIE